MFDFVIYHKNCYDGFTSFVVAKMSGKIADDAIILPYSPSFDCPTKIENKNILMLDIALKKEVIEEICKKASKVTYIDHHITSQNIKECENIDVIFDNNECGATLTWKYFFGNKKMPLFLEYVRDNDIGLWKMENTSELLSVLEMSGYIMNVEYVDKWIELIKDKKNNEIKKLIKSGVTFYKYLNHIMKVNYSWCEKNYVLFPSEKVIEKFPENYTNEKQYKVALIEQFNVIPSVTEISKYIFSTYEHIDFCVFWCYSIETKKYSISMRSKEFNVGALCKLFNGGGHVLASGCKLDSTDMKIDDLFIIPKK